MLSACACSFRAIQNFPEHQFPSIVGRPILRTEEQAGDIVVKDIMCGDEAAAARSMLQVTYPVCFLFRSVPPPCGRAHSHVQPRFSARRIVLTMTDSLVA